MQRSKILAGFPAGLTGTKERALLRRGHHETNNGRFPGSCRHFRRRRGGASGYPAFWPAGPSRDSVPGPAGKHRLCSLDAAAVPARETDLPGLSPFESQRTAARVAGFVFPISFITVVAVNFGIFARLIVSGDPTKTAQNILANETLFRIGIAGCIAISTTLELRTGELPPKPPADRKLEPPLMGRHLLGFIPSSFDYVNLCRFGARLASSSADFTGFVGRKVSIGLRGDALLFTCGNSGRCGPGDPPRRPGCSSVTLMSFRSRPLNFLFTGRIFVRPRIFRAGKPGPKEAGSRSSCPGRATRSNPAAKAARGCLRLIIETPGYGSTSESSALISSLLVAW